MYILFVYVEKAKAVEIVDESDRELIRVARGDVEDEEPKQKAHLEKKRSTEGKFNVKTTLSCTSLRKVTVFFLLCSEIKRNKRAAEEGKFVSL